MKTKLYFAYGSNINLDQMAHRCPAARVMGPVILENYELLFRGNASGTGVATIASREGSRVHGLLWRITAACEKSLDFYEGYPRLYQKEPVTVCDRNGQQITVMAYVMTDDARWMSPAMPSQYYYEGIQAGYRQNGLPVRELKKAWDQCAKEAAWYTAQINRTLGEQDKPSKRKSSHER